MNRPHADNLNRYKTGLAAVLLLTVLLSQPSLAGPRYLVLERPANGTEYAELHTVRRTTEGAVAWVIQDLRHPDLTGNLSKLSLQEVDCVKRKVRIRLERRYTGNRAEGRPSKIDKVDHSWQPGPTGSPYGYLIEQFCGAK